MPRLTFCESGKGCKHLDYRNFSEKKQTFTKWRAYCTLCRTTPQYAKGCDKPGLFTTQELIDELCKREGVREYQPVPYLKRISIQTEGTETVLVIRKVVK